MRTVNRVSHIRRVSAAVGAVGIAGVMCVVMVNAAIPARAWDMFIAFGAAGGTAGVLVAYAFLRTLRDAFAITRFVLPALAFVGTLMLVGAALIGINRFADQSPVTVHTAKVEKRYRTAPTVNSRNYSHSFVSVASWLDDGKLIKVFVRDQDMDALQLGATIQVSTHEGRLGWPWVEPYAP